MGIICNQNDLEIVRRMGKPSQDKIRPINITLITYGKKVSILKKKKTLENTTIYIKEDFPPQILEVRKSLQNQLQKERNEGHNAYIRYDKIVVRKPDRTQQLGNSKKRELEITPPPQSAISSSMKDRDGLVKYQAAKKNKISKESQSSMKMFVQKRNESTGSGSSSNIAARDSSQ